MAGAPKGNTNARRENHLITDALRRAVVQSPEKLNKACMKVLDDAVEGNLAAFNTLADRLDGKPAQTNILQGDEDNPVAITKITRALIDAVNTDS